jgi:hypothetical protein
MFEENAKEERGVVSTLRRRCWMIDGREIKVDEGPVLYQSQDISYPVGKKTQNIWNSPQTPR